MGAACDYLMGIGMERVAAHEHALAKYLYEVRFDGGGGGG